MLLDSFDSSKREHVEWLRDLMNADISKKMDIIKNNPLNEDVPPFEMIHIMFGLAAKYTKAVFENTAYLPSHKP